MNIEDIPGSKKEKTYEDIMSEFEKFGMAKTADFKEALTKKDFEKVKEWLKFIDDNRKDFSQYNDSWFSDRHREIRVMEENPDRKWEPTQTVEAAKKFLNKKFRFSTTSGFQETLEGDIKTAEEWFNHIINNSNDFPQYHATWNPWVEDRKNELEKAKSK